MSAGSERQRLEAEYQDLNYLWEEEVFSAHPDWEKLEQWDLERRCHARPRRAARAGWKSAASHGAGTRAPRPPRPGLARLMSDARQGKFQVLAVWSCDRLARSVRHFLETLDELNRLGVEFLSFREQLDTGGPLGRAVTVIIAAISELERHLIVERVRSGMRRAKLEGRRLGRPPLPVDVDSLVRDRQGGLSMSQLANRYEVGREHGAEAAAAG